MMAARLEGLAWWGERSSYTDGLKNPLSQLTPGFGRVKGGLNKPQINDSSLSDRIPADVRYCELTAEFHLDS